MMNLRKVVSAGMVMCVALGSFTGCNSAKAKAATEVANSFLEGVLDCQSKKVSKTIVEDDEESEYLAELDTYSSGTVADILDKATYEVDEDSIEVDKDECSIDYEIEMPDPEDVAKCGDIKKADERSVTVTIELELDDDEWLVSNFEEVCEDIFDDELVNCVVLKTIDREEFISALEDFDIDYEEYDADFIQWIYEDGEYAIESVGTDNTYLYAKFEDADAAYDFFEDDLYDFFEDELEDDAYDGILRMNLTQNKGYIILDCEVEGDDYYGGLFLSDDVVIYAILVSGSKSDKKDIDSFLDAIGYPKP